MLNKKGRGSAIVKRRMKKCTRNTDQKNQQGTSMQHAIVTVFMVATVLVIATALAHGVITTVRMVVTVLVIATVLMVVQKHRVTTKKTMMNNVAHVKENKAK